MVEETPSMGAGVAVVGRCRRHRLAWRVCRRDMVRLRRRKSDLARREIALGVNRQLCRHSAADLEPPRNLASAQSLAPQRYRVLPEIILPTAVN